MSDLWLIDKSAFVRLEASPEADTWRTRMDRGLVRVSSLTLLELGFSARSGADWHRGIRQPPASELPLEPLVPRMEARALEIQGMLAEVGHHRAAKIPDLVIAATAEVAGLTVLHVDKDFELIGEVTGQPMERLTGDF